MAEPQESLLGVETPAENPNETTQEWYPKEYSEKVTKKGWKEPSDAVKSYFELEKSYGGRLKMPTPESSAEEIRAFYQKTGCPENPEGYEIKIEDSRFRNEGVENALKQVAYEEGVSKQAFEALVRKYYGKLNEDLVQSIERGKMELQKELGAKYNEELKIAQRYCATCSDEFKELLEVTGLGNHPVFIKEFIVKGKQILSDTIIKGDSAGDKEPEYVPQYKDSPDMYRSGEDDESKKAREYFKSRGFKY